ncbi:Integrase core domain-containing protein [Streptomyces sp. 136MFCol5.1]|nr:Integrase core domain-containing protein [Streptomyces sp. 136MFCol5.1]SFS37085.1 Integrase core domain-containing protein [Streptomyces sp. ok210]
MTLTAENTFQHLLIDSTWQHAANARTYTAQDPFLLEEWAYLRPYTTNTERTAALADFLHTYNHHRCHTALDGKPPISRVNNATGQYT